MELRLTPEQHELLIAILEEHHRELLLELAHADHHEFKLKLRKQAVLLEELLTQLTVPKLVQQ